MVGCSVAEFTRESRRLRAQLASASRSWQLWLEDDARAELRQLLQAPPADDTDGSALACEQLASEVNMVRRRVLRLRQLCQPPVTRADLPAIQRVAATVRQHADTAARRCRRSLSELAEQEQLLTVAVGALTQRLSESRLAACPAGQTRPASAPARTRAAAAAATGAGAGAAKGNASRQQPPELAAYDTFLRETGGLTGGWDAEEHAQFLKLRARHRATSPLVQAASQRIFTRSVSDVVQHVHWHDRLLQLAEQRRRCIRAWRDARTAAAAAAAAAAAHQTIEESPSQQTRGHARRCVVRARSTRAPPHNTASPATSSSSTAAAGATGSRPQSHAAPSAAEVRARERCQRQQQERRAQVAEYRERKRHDQELRWRHQRQTEELNRHLRARMAAKTMEVFRRRDEEYARRRRSARLGQQSSPSQLSAEVAPAPLRPRSCSASRARLLAESSATRRRRLAAQTHPGPVTVALGVVALPRRGLPAWRVGL